MAFIHGKNSRLWIGPYEMSRYFNQFDVGIKVAPVDVGKFGDKSKVWMAGIGSGTMSAKGYMGVDTLNDTEDQVLAADLGQYLELLLAPTGATSTGSPCVPGYGIETAYEISAPVSGVVSTSLEVTSSSPLNTGKWLVDPTATTTSTGTANTFSTVTWPNPAPGAVIVLNLLSLLDNSTTGPTLTVTVQHSPDNTNWSTLATFGPYSVVSLGGSAYGSGLYGVGLYGYGAGVIAAGAFGEVFDPNVTVYPYVRAVGAMTLGVGGGLGTYSIGLGMSVGM